MAIRKRKATLFSGEQSINKERISNSNELISYLKQVNLFKVPLPLVEIVHHFGLTLKLLPLPDKTSGSLKFNNSKWEIAVNSLHHPNRQRFTIAHELGHFFLHRETNKDFEDFELFRNGDSNPVEYAANKFAAEILMPSSEFTSYIKNESNLIQNISNNFGVSAVAVKIRAEQITQG